MNLLGGLHRPAPGLAVALLVLCAVGASADEGDGLATAIRSTRLEPTRAVEVASLEVEIGPAVLRLDRGRIIPSTPLGGRTLEFVFIGEGRFSVKAPDAVEAQQLRLFAGDDSLDVAVTRAILLAGDHEVEQLLLARPAAPPDAEADLIAAGLYATWLAGAERRGSGAEGALFKTAIGDERAAGAFIVWCRSAQVGDFYVLVDPFETEQVTLGQFVSADLDEIEEHRIEREIRKQRRRGRMSQVRVTDLGDFDVWLSTTLPDAEGKPVPGGEPIDTMHYSMEIEVDRDDERIRGTARVTLLGAGASRRAATFALHPDLAVRAVRDDDGRDLVFFRSGESAHVAFAEPLAPGEERTLEVEWDGVLFDEIVTGVFVSRTTTTWYPRFGLLDRATYDVTLRWPARRQLFASGAAVDEGSADGTRWQRRRMERPGFGFSFEYGDFDVHSAEAGHVAVTVAFNKMPSNWGSGVKQQTVETIVDALGFLEERFGPYPRDYLTVVTVPRGFSQGLPGFVTLAHRLVALPRGNYYIWVDKDDPHDRHRTARNETIAHELSHQWWGNEVGWSSYRDQWLSEALADFSATLYMSEREKQGTIYLAQHAQGWKSQLNRTTKDGREFAGLGPVVVGQRLLSSAAPSAAYAAIVYAKGSVVFSMLARALGREPFTEMLKELVAAVNNRTISTETFLRAIEHMAGADLQRFADQYVYGTALPEFYYRYAVREGADGGWLVEGEAHQVAGTRSRYRLTLGADGRWNVFSERVAGRVDPDLALVVPFQVALRSERPTKQDDSRELTRVERGLGGTLVLRGESSVFSIPLAEQPRHFWLDQRGEVLAEFFAENHRPKLVMRWKAHDQPAEQAEATLRSALDAPLYSEAGLHEVDLSERELERQTRLADSVVLMRLAEVLIDGGRDDEARAAFAAAREKLGRDDASHSKGLQTVLASRLDVRAGDFKAAYARLSGYLHLDFDRTSSDTVFDAARRKRFREGRILGGDAYALLALAAHMTEHPEVARAALDEAEERGADVTELRRHVEGRPSGG